MRSLFYIHIQNCLIILCIFINMLPHLIRILNWRCSVLCPQMGTLWQWLLSQEPAPEQNYLSTYWAKLPLSCEERLRTSGLSSLEKRGLGVTSLLSAASWGGEGERAMLISPLWIKWQDQWEWFKLHQERFRLELKKYFLPEREVADQNKLPREVANNPFLSILKKSMPSITLIFAQSWSVVGLDGHFRPSEMFCI